MQFRIERRDEDRAYLVVGCARGVDGECRFGLWMRPAGSCTWQWDGNVATPTVTPSIDCKGGCDRHFSIIAGKVV
jgi:hypothetical protein